MLHKLHDTMCTAHVSHSPQSPGPGTDGLDVDSEKVLMGGRGDGEAVELLWGDGSARGLDVLTREKFVVWRPIELDLDHVRGQDICLKDIELHVAATEADHLVQGVHDPGHHEEHPELGRGGDPSQAVDEAEQVQEHVQLVTQPEEAVGALSDGGGGEDEHDDHDAVERHSGHPSHGLKEPVADVRRHPGREEDLLGHALEVVGRLGAQVVEVDHVGHRVDQREEQGGHGADLVELKVGVEGNVLVEAHLLQLGDQVLGDREKQKAVAEREGIRGATRDRDTKPHYFPEICVFNHEGEVLNMKYCEFYSW